MPTDPKPLSLGLWATDLAARVEPPNGKRAAGFQDGEEIAAQWLNYLFWDIVQWLLYLDDLEANAHVWTAQQTINALVKAISVAPSAGNTYAEVLRLMPFAGTSKGHLFLKGGGAGNPVDLMHAVNLINSGVNLVREDIGLGATLFEQTEDGFGLNFWHGDRAGLDIAAMFTAVNEEQPYVQIEGLPKLRIRGLLPPVEADEPATKGFVETMPTVTYPSAFLNNWASKDVPPDGNQAFGYYKTREGRVHFVGAIKSGTLASWVIQMPPGFRSSKQVAMFVPGGALSTDTALVVYTHTGGDHLIVNSATGNAVIDMSGFSYLADG